MIPETHDLATPQTGISRLNAESAGMHVEPPFVTTLGSLDDVRNGYDGNNYDWSEWYYFDY